MRGQMPLNVVDEDHQPSSRGPRSRKTLESFLSTLPNARDQHAGEDPFIPRASDGRLFPHEYGHADTIGPLTAAASRLGCKV